MAKQQFDPNDAKLLALEIEKIYKRIGLSNPFSNGVHTVSELKDGLEDARDILLDWEDGVGDIEKGFRSILNEVNATGKSFNVVKRSLTSITSISTQLRDQQLGINQLSSKQLITLKSKLDSEATSLKNNIAALQTAKKELEDKKEKDGLNKKEESHLLQLKSLITNTNGTLEKKEGIQQQLNDKLQDEIKYRENIEKKLGVTGGILRGISKIPILGDLVDTNEALHVAESTIEITKSGVAGLGAAMGNLGKQAISGLLNPSNLILGAFTLIGKVLKDVDKGAGEYAKSMNVTYSEALNVRGEMQSIAASSGDVALNSSRLQETLMAVGKEMGSNAKLNEADLITFTKLREQAGYTNEELMGIQKLSLVNNKTLEANTKEILGAAAAYNGKNKLALNEKQILKDVNSASAALKLSLGGSVTQLTNAAAKAREFGLSLEQTEKIAESLLNFESSIESELSAELLTGRNLNLEQARLLALNGKTAEAATEIAKQVGTSADFARMNVIQQEAIAKAAGMERKELAQSLIDKESLSKLGVKDAKSAQDAYNQLRAQGMSEMEIQKRLGDKKLADQYEQQSAQDRFNQSVEKLKDIFVSLAEPVLQILSPIADFVGLLSSVPGLLKGIAIGFGIIKTLQVASYALELATTHQKMVQGSLDARALMMGKSKLAQMVAQAVAWTIMNPIPAAIGVAAATGVGALIYSAMKGATPVGDFRYSNKTGETTISTKEGGLYSISDNDEIAVAPRINARLSSPPSPQPTQDNSALIAELRAMRSIFEKNQNRPIYTEVKVDGEKIANATNNSNRKNSYAIS
jgi:hypothetical protein